MQIKESVKYIILNHFANCIPSWTIRRFIYRFFGMKIGKGSRIMMKNTVLAPDRIQIGENSIINEYCHLDGRGGLVIGNNVSISIHSIILTASHSKSSSTFEYRTGKVQLEDNVWIGAAGIVLDSSHMRESSILSAGSVLKGECTENSVYAGNPAKYLKERGLKEKYTIKWNPIGR